MCLPVHAQQEEEARLLRFPSIHDDQIVFSYAGDLFAVSVEGGVARRLTTGEGYEMFPRFSPDGRQIAFTGQYDGNTEVYVMDAEGGQPRRMTYTATLRRDDVADRMGPNNVVLGWTPGGDSVLYRSRGESFNSFKGKVYAAPLSGDLPRQLPFSVASWMSYSPDAKALAMNRVFREFRTWKGYRGGMADDVWRYDRATGQSENLTDHPAQDIFPMWRGRKVYFISDRDGRFNLYSLDLDTRKLNRHTDFTAFDIKFPSAGPDNIVFENGGALYRFHLETGQMTPVPVYLNSDRTASRPKMVAGGEDIHYADVHPNGERMVFSARGELMTVSAKEGAPVHRLTRSFDAHDRYVAWSPDGKHIAYISDQSGENELYVQKADGSDPARQITESGGPFKYQPVWSPDGEKLLWGDRAQVLRYVEVESGKTTEVYRSEEYELRDYRWSPDSRWVCYTRPDLRSYSRVWLYDTKKERQHPVTDGFYAASNPAFSPDGKYLYYASARHFNPLYSRTEWNHAFRDMEGIYMVLLEKGTPNPLQPDDPNRTRKDEEKDKKDDDEAPEVKIDFEGLERRTLELPLEPGSYYGLQPVADGLIYGRNTLAQDKPDVRRFQFGEKEDAALGTFRRFIVSGDGKKIGLQKGRKQFFIADIPPVKALKGGFDPGDPLDLSGMRMMVDRQAEWRQIYTEAWRQMRDFFYDPGMHGVDWDAMYDKYEPLLEHVGHRNDLSYIIGELIGELNVGHAYVGGGDRPQPERYRTGLLGAQLQRTEAGSYRIDNLLPGANWSQELRSPLLDVGVNIEEGQYITAVNGQPTAEMTNIYASLIGAAGTPTTLTIAEDADGEEELRQVVVKPLSDESDLRYYAWVQERMRMADELSDGKVGYLHIPDMVQNGLSQFARYFYPQLEKEALIIDVRGNGGGNVSPMIIERLRRVVGMGATLRNGAAYTKPRATHIGPKAALTDGYTASDGDLFSYQFRYYDLGPLIGSRTWGGVIGIRGSMPFVDGGMLRKPEFAHYSADGEEWIIENEGVSPDIEVIQDPHQEYLGQDQQLERAVQYLLEALEKNDPGVPPVPDFPNKSDRK